MKNIVLRKCERTCRCPCRVSSPSSNPVSVSVFCIKTSSPAMAMGSYYFHGRIAIYVETSACRERREMLESIMLPGPSSPATLSRTSPPANKCAQARPSYSVRCTVFKAC